MKRNTAILVMLLAMVACLCTADSETRPSTQNEKQFYSRAIQACLEASSSTGTTWEKIDESGHEQEELESIVVGAENAPMVHHYYVEWADQQKLEAANNEISAALAARVPESQKAAEQVDVKQLEDLAEQIAAAASAGNMAEVEKLNARAEEIAARNDEIFSETDREFRETVEKLAARDARAVIRIGINQFYQGFDAEPVKGTLADGTVFYRVENGRMYNDSWVEGTSYILLGSDWQPLHDESGFSMERQEKEGAPYTSIQTVVIAVEAEQKRAEAMLNSMKIKALKDLVKE
ncbi:MAG: hypothetical protein PHD82_12050 [Candidatus Riflebacteria bacterium]|nr:hypothetical protein [Candidatus Riflebacteria bacterium]